MLLRVGNFIMVEEFVLFLFARYEIVDADIVAMTPPEKEKGSRKGAKINIKDISWDHIVLGEQQEKAGGPMVQSCTTIGGFDTMALTTVELRELAANLKLTGYRSKSKFDLLLIISMEKKYSAHYTQMEVEGNLASTSKPPSKTTHCVFHLINILFSDRIAPKLSWLGQRKDRFMLDSGLAGEDEHFWQEVEGDEEEYGRLVDEEHPMFSDIEPSKKLNHSWSKLCKIWKNLLKNYNNVHENWKQRGNHDDFLSFCNGKSDVFYLFL
jgi:hypothetical protein